MTDCWPSPYMPILLFFCHFIQYYLGKNTKTDRGTEIYIAIYHNPPCYVHLEKCLFCTTLGYNVRHICFVSAYIFA